MKTYRKNMNASIMTWFDKYYGNTYFSATIEDSKGRIIAVLPFQYGCYRHGTDMCFTALKRIKKDRGADYIEQIAFVNVQHEVLKRDVVQHGKTELFTAGV